MLNCAFLVGVFGRELFAAAVILRRDDGEDFRVGIEKKLGEESDPI